MTPDTEAMLRNLQQQAEIISLKLPKAEDFKPADTYELLLRQFSAMKTLIHCLEQRLALLDPYTEHRASKELDSLKQANEWLTNELEALEGTLAGLDRAVVEKLDMSRLDVYNLPKHHPFRLAIRRDAARASKTPMSA